MVRVEITDSDRTTISHFFRGLDSSSVCQKNRPLVAVLLFKHRVFFRGKGDKRPFARQAADLFKAVLNHTVCRCTIQRIALQIEQTAVLASNQFFAPRSTMR